MTIKARRFWTDASVSDSGTGFGVRLDDKPVNTPSGAPLEVPTREMAEKIAAEFAAQVDRIDPLSMPWTRSANSAIDKVSEQKEEVAAFLAGYAGTDLLSYRATRPQSLIDRQAEVWDALLEKTAEETGTRLAVTSGVMPVAQDAAALDRLTAPVHQMTAFELTGFHELVTLTGSFVLALATIRNWRPLDELWSASRVDEEWQAEQWGHDEEADALAETRKAAFLHGAAFFRASR